MHETLPPEILDRILDYLRGDNRSLSACALAARVMLPRTRYHRFRSVILRPMHARSDLLPLLNSSPELTELVTSVRMVYLVNKEFEQELDVLARLPALTALTAVSTTNLLAFPWRSLATAASYAPALTSLHLIGPGLMLPEEGLSVLSRFHSLEEIRLRLVQFMDENPLEYFHSYARRHPAPASLRRVELRQADMNLVVGRWIQSTSPAPIMCSVRHYISDGMDANQFETMTEWWSGTVENLEVVFEPEGNMADILEDFPITLSPFSVLEACALRFAFGEMCVASNQSLPWIITILSQLSSRRLRHLTFSLVVDNVEDLRSLNSECAVRKLSSAHFDDMRVLDWNAIERSLTSPTMEHLREFVVEGQGRQDLLESHIQSSCPELTARRLVTFRTVDKEVPWL